MHLIKLIQIEKEYRIDKKHTFKALDHISLDLPNAGLVSIVGKSGSGKSTLLNILAGLDKYNHGRYIFKGKDVSSFTNKERRIFLNARTSVVFQHYHLLEDKSVTFNIILPSLIHGTTIDKAKEEALLLVNGIGFDNNLLDKKVSDLSGGEKQRVAILRSLINSPNVIFCDEPTGALDSKNSIRIMELLKKASKNKLVVVVSHNLELVKRYSNRIIQMKKGRVISDEIVDKHIFKGTPIVNNVFFRKNDKWINNIITDNFKKRKLRNIFLVGLMSFSLLITTLIISFIYGSKYALINASYKHIDYGVITITKEEKSSIDNSFISLVKESRPTISNKEDIYLMNDELKVTNNYDILFPSVIDYKYNEETITSLISKPIYNFSSTYINKELLYDHNINIDNSFNYVLINQKAYDLLEKTFKYSPINQIITSDYFYQSQYYTFDNVNTVVEDTYYLSKDFVIAGIVDELDYLSSPTIYYCYEGFISYLKEYKLNNLSEYLSEGISWIDRINNASDVEEISSYSCYGFLRVDQYNNLPQYIANINALGLSVNSLSLSINESLSSLISASATGLITFLAISLIGLVLIFGILSLFSYQRERKQNAILTALGASNSSIINIYLFENLFTGVISYFLAMALAFPFIKLVNLILSKVVKINNVLAFPFGLLSNIKVDYILLSLLSVILIIVLSTIIPVIFSKRISIAEELRDE